MNIEKRIKEELQSAAEFETGRAEASVLLIGRDGGNGAVRMVGNIENLISLLVKALKNLLASLPDEMEKGLRIKIAAMILGGDSDAAR